MSCVAWPLISALDRAPFSLPDVQVYSGEEECSADQLSRPVQVLPTEWSLLPRIFKVICRVIGRPQLYLFATRANAKLPLYISPVPNLMAWKQEVFWHPLDHLSACAFRPFALLRQVFSRVLLSTRLSLVLVVPLWPLKEWFADLLACRSTNHSNICMCATCWSSPTSGSSIEA